MKSVITILLWLLLAGIAGAQSPPNGVPCNANGSTGPVTLCKPGWTYGCVAGPASNTILQTDGNRTSIQFQNTSGTVATLTFGDTSISTNGWQVQPGNSYLWSNMNQGNTPGRVTSSAISITGNGPCVFMFTE